VILLFIDTGSRGSKGCAGLVRRATLYLEHCTAVCAQGAMQGTPSSSSCCAYAHMSIAECMYAPWYCPRI
jgi:hypothetical protein